MRKVLEMGYGGFPLGRSTNFDIMAFSRKLPPDTIYFGIDDPMRSDATSALLSTMVTMQCVDAVERECQLRRPARVHLLRMDARRTLFSDATFQEVHLHNVITDPRVTEIDIQALVFEAKRLLSPGGMLFASCEGGCSGEERISELHFQIVVAGLVKMRGVSLDDVTAFADDLSELWSARLCYSLIARKE